jgi:hypothetical protein
LRLDYGGRRTAIGLRLRGLSALRLNLGRRLTVIVLRLRSLSALRLGLGRLSAVLLRLLCHGPSLRLDFGLRRRAASLVLHRGARQPPVFALDKRRHGFELGLKILDPRLMLPLQQL